MTKFAKVQSIIFLIGKQTFFKTGFSDGRSTFVFTDVSSRMRSHNAVTIENGNRVTAAVTIATGFMGQQQYEQSRLTAK